MEISILLQTTSIMGHKLQCGSTLNNSYTAGEDIKSFQLTLATMTQLELVQRFLLSI